jgi:hypothetical protein
VRYSFESRSLTWQPVGLLALLPLCSLAITACTVRTTPSASVLDAAASAPPSAPASPDASASGTPSIDAGAPAVVDGGVVPSPNSTPDPSDGVPERRVCTEVLGSAISESFGRLDGRIVSVVKPGARACNADRTHVHLQVEANAATYDIAVNIDSLISEVAHPLTGGPWSDGWHPSGSLDYVSDLGVSARVFVPTNPQALQARLETANYVSVFAIGYGPDGAHLVHRNRRGRDGAVVLNPRSKTPTYLLFRFDQQAF